MKIEQAGVPLAADTPEDSRPRPDDLIQTLDEIGRGEVLARKSTDGTRWCRSCDHTAPPGGKSAFCPDHAAKRGPQLKRLRREARKQQAQDAARIAASTVARQPVVPEGKALVDIEVLTRIVRLADMLSIHVTRASKPYQDLDRPVWLDNLMLSAKNLDAAIDSGLCNGEVLPVRRVQRVVARPAKRP